MRKLRIPEDHRQTIRQLIEHAALLDELAAAIPAAQATYELRATERRIGRLLVEYERRTNEDLPFSAKDVAAVLFAMALASDTSESPEVFASDLIGTLALDTADPKIESSVQCLIKLVTGEENALLLSVLAATALGTGGSYGSVEISFHTVQVVARNNTLVGAVPYHLVRVVSTEMEGMRQSLAARLSDSELRELKAGIDNALLLSSSLKTQSAARGFPRVISELAHEDRDETEMQEDGE